MIYLLRRYATYEAGATVTLDADTEAALVAQGIGTKVSNGASARSVVGAPDMYATQGGNNASMPQGGLGSAVSSYQGPLRWPCIALGSAALTGYETNGVAPVAGSIDLTEIFVPFYQTWTGVGVLNGTTVGTDSFIVALYGSNGDLLANSSLAGTLSAGASVFQNIPFTTPLPLLPGRYFTAFQSNGTTATVRHLLAANGSVPCTSRTAGTFGTLPATMTPPTTFTTAVGVITQLYV